MGDEGAPTNHEYKGKVNAAIVRSFAEDMKYLKRVSPWKFEISPGFVGNMKVPGVFYVNAQLEQLIFDELRQYSNNSYGGFLPAVKQIANVASLPGIVKHSIGLPDLHSGYGFAIGNVAAFDMSDPNAVVSPGFYFIGTYLFIHSSYNVNFHRRSRI